MKPKPPNIPYARQSIDDADLDAVRQVMESDFLTQGPMVGKFEEAAAARLGARHGVAVASGTAALHAACFAAQIGPGDEVVTSPITFAATGNCALYLGASVKFCDIRPDTYCLDPEKLEAAITPRTKAVLPVDFAGQPCDLEEISAIAERRGVTVIEDAAHAFGASYKGAPVGSLAAMTAFSFHPVKTITTGEGGLVTTNDAALEKRLRAFKTHGVAREESEMLEADEAADNAGAFNSRRNPNTAAPWYYEMQHLGFNYRITDIQCALGLSQMEKLERFIARRRQIARRYSEAFHSSGRLIVPHQETDRQSAWHLYVIRLRLEGMERTRRQVFEALRNRGIGVQIHYIPLHLQPYYRSRFGYGRGDFPEAEAFYDSAITLPLFPGMTDAECDRVIEAVLAETS